MTLGQQIGRRIEEVIAERGLSYRRVQLRLCELRPGSTESGWRTQLVRWRRGQVPEPEQARLLAEALEVDPAEFTPAAVTQAQFDDLQAELASLRRLADAERQQNEELRAQLARLERLGRRPQDMLKPNAQRKASGS